MYSLGPGKTFVKYPATTQTLIMQNIVVVTKDKQYVTIDVQVQYQLNPETLTELFKERQQSYDSFYKREAEQLLKEECVEWETIPHFYQSRTDIADGMRAKVKQMLEENHAKLVDFHLNGITLQGATETKIIETLVAEQDIITAQNIQRSTVVRAEKDEISSKAIAEINVSVFFLQHTFGVKFVFVTPHVTSFLPGL